MENNDSRLSRIIASISDWFGEQSWFQQLKAKWDEQDPQHRIYLKIAGIGSVILVVFFTFIFSFVGVVRLKRELADKQEILTTLQTASDELRRLRDASSTKSVGATSTAPWSHFIEGLAATAGIEKTVLTVGQEKPGKVSEQSKEVLFEITVKHVNIKQVVRFAYYLESGARPVKLRNLTIDTKADPTGYMDATYFVSAFTVVGKT